MWLFIDYETECVKANKSITKARKGKPSDRPEKNGIGQKSCKTEG